MMFGNSHMEMKSTFFGRHFMSSLLWQTEPEKMIQILRVMGKTYEEYQLPIDYEALGIVEC